MSKYFEFVDANSQDIADACNCKVGQTVGRVYSDGDPIVIVGTRAEVEAAVAEEMSK